MGPSLALFKIENSLALWTHIPSFIFLQNSFLVVSPIFLIGFVCCWSPEGKQMFQEAHFCPQLLEQSWTHRKGYAIDICLCLYLPLQPPLPSAAQQHPMTLLIVVQPYLTVQLHSLFLEFSDPYSSFSHFCLSLKTQVRLDCP